MARPTGEAFSRGQSLDAICAISDNENAGSENRSRASSRAPLPLPLPPGSRPLRDASLDSFGRPMRRGTLRALRLLALVFCRAGEGEGKPVLLPSGGNSFRVGRIFV